MSATEMQPKSTTNPFFAFLRDFSITGGVYFASCTITSPIRKALFHLGTQDIFSYKPKYTGIMNYLVNTVKNDGIGHLWAFNVGFYMREVSGVAFNFALHESCKKILPQFSPISNQLEYMLMQFISGGLAILTTRSFQHPLDFLSTYEYRDLKPGFRACFNGLGDVAPISMIYGGLYFGLFDIWKEMRRDQHSFVEKLGVAHGISLISTIAIYPIGVAKNEVFAKAHRLVSKRKFYNGTIQELFKIGKEQGVKGLFKGLTGGYPILSSIKPACTLVLFDEVRGWLLKQE